MSLFSLLIALVLPAAQARSLDTFSLSGALFDDAGTLQLSHPQLGAPRATFAGVGLGYARDPLVLDIKGELTSVVSSQLSTRLVGGVVLDDFARIEVELPLYPSVVILDESRAAAGDLRLAATAPVFSARALSLGVSPYVTLPTGAADAFVSAGSLVGGGLALAALEFGALGLTANLGLEASRAGDLASLAADEGVSAEEQLLGSALPGGVGASYRLSDGALVGAELDGALDLAGGLAGFEQNPAELHFYTTGRTRRGLVLTGGVGTGLVAASGVPTWRMLAGVGYRSPGQVPIEDLDADGLSDAEDRCPDAPEDYDGFEDGDGCPDLDDDADGIADLEDDCPADAEDYDGFEDGDGCPELDNDGDGVADAIDACPNEPAHEHADLRRSDGCPARVVVTRGAIVIQDKIFFEYNEATILEESFDLLGEVARVLNNFPEIRLVEVQGHADHIGSDGFNLKLSQARAGAVIDHLVTFGEVDDERLESVGYGERAPAVEGRDDEARAANRRVQFIILEDAGVDAD